jgi:ATP-dependent Lhr-like helicase
VLTGDKVPRLLGARVLYRDGVVVATWVAGKLDWQADASLDEQRLWRRTLLREPEHPELHGVAPYESRACRRHWIPQ